MPKILIIDDDVVTARTFLHLLRLDGFDAAIAHDGRTGIASAVSERFELITVDLRLPDIGGIDVVRELRARGVGTPLIIVTAFPGFESSFDAGAVGAAGYLEGPLSYDEFLEVIRHALRGEFPVRRPAGELSVRPGAARGASTGAGASLVDARIRDVLRMIEARPAVEIDTLAARVDLSTSRLRHLFAAATGVPLSRFIRSRRLQLGARLLLTTYDRIEQVAHISGLTNFRKAFRSHFGESPQAYRTHFQRRDG